MSDAAQRADEAGRRPKVGLACNDMVLRRYIDQADVDRLTAVASFEARTFTFPSEGLRTIPRDAAAEHELGQFATDLDALIVCHGAPYVSAEVLQAAPKLSLLGELEGDRFGYHFDVDAAASRGVRVVDTTHGSSWPTAEWALGLALIGRRNAGAYFRRMINHEQAFPEGRRPFEGPGFEGAELSGKRIGMIGFGHVARRLVDLLAPFHVQIVAFDPYVSRDLAGAYGVDFGPLALVMDADVVFCLAPHTPGTVKLIGAREFDLLRARSVFVNVSRGVVVDTEAMIARLRRGDVIACLDVFDPEPLPVDSPVLDLPNVFVSPHIAGVTEESRRRFFALMVDELLRHFSGREPWSVLTPRVVTLRTTGHLEMGQTGA